MGEPKTGYYRQRQQTTGFLGINILCQTQQRARTLVGSAERQLFRRLW
jgi:hypothetical protein